MINFDLSKIEAKCEGRSILANIVGIAQKDAAKFFCTATHENFKDSFNSFTSKYPTIAKQISDLKPDGVGPGEVLAWFLFDNVTLGGKSSPVDIFIDGKPFAEMKAGSHTKKTNTLDYFKITKDTDPAVSLILNDILRFNYTYREIMGDDLPGWNGVSSIKVGALSLWESINLTILQRITPPVKRRKYVPIDPDGTILHTNEEQCIGTIYDPDISQKLKAILKEDSKVKIDKEIESFTKIIERWKKQVFTDSVAGKKYALVDMNTMKMHHFGEIHEKMLGIYRVHRNQPWARIYLDQI